MIHYDQWLSNDAILNAEKARSNEANAARFYAGLKPIRIVAGQTGSLLRQAWQLWRSHAGRRLAVRELKALDDRLLQDIGVLPGDISKLVWATPNSQAEEQAVTRPTPVTSTKTVADSKPTCDVIELDAVRPTLGGQTTDGAERRNARRSRDAA